MANLFLSQSKGINTKDDHMMYNVHVIEQLQGLVQQNETW
jgi:hypothetical protein